MVTLSSSLAVCGDKYRKAPWIMFGQMPQRAAAGQAFYMFSIVTVQRPAISPGTSGAGCTYCLDDLHAAIC